ncbi:MAG: serine protease [Candidatus Pacebacteria bacterium]|jgi:S1-C subfamily serine protease|nr:serine protease [Candidatus Paceibacterota bacterium]|tara:strand:+ start:31338 stop:32495 length:1158 start_codon:yes stop_codon:yes gene_type:complete
MKAFILLILIGIVVFFGTSKSSVRDVAEFKQEPEFVFDEENELELLESSSKSEIEIKEEEIIVVEEVQEIIVEIPEVISLPDSTQENVVKLVVPKKEEKPKILFKDINISTREALVNIFCTTKFGGLFKPITGSGIVIDEKGIILTNAHIAQYFLLKDYLTEDFVDCVVRKGSPAKPQYKAVPIFISPSWIENNAKNIREQSPTGTGEDDYALILINKHVNPEKNIPESFSFISPEYDSEKIKINDTVLLAAYPAGFLGGISIQKDLYLSSTVTKIMELFTFKESTLDVFSIGGSIVAQQGSSGGAVVNGENKLLGIIVTSSTAETTQDRDLRAITISHINRSFIKDVGFDLQTIFSGDVAAEAEAFNKNIAPILTQFLENELDK